MTASLLCCQSHSHMGMSHGAQLLIRSGGTLHLQALADTAWVTGSKVASRKQDNVTFHSAWRETGLTFHCRRCNCQVPSPNVAAHGSSSTSTERPSFSGLPRPKPQHSKVTSRSVSPSPSPASRQRSRTWGPGYSWVGWADFAAVDCLWLCGFVSKRCRVQSLPNQLLELSTVQSCQADILGRPLILHCFQGPRVFSGI